MSGNALDEFYAAPVELKQHVDGEPVPTLHSLFEHMDRALGSCETTVSEEVNLKRWRRKKVRASGTLRVESEVPAC